MTRDAGGHVVSPSTAGLWSDFPLLDSHTRFRVAGTGRDPGRSSVVDSSTYVIRGGLEGRERLRVLSRVMWPGTSALFDRIGIAQDANCLDVGCGSGDVAIALAQRASQGRTVGVDIDEAKIDLAIADGSTSTIPNVEFRVGNIFDAPTDSELFDVVYVRFVLTHLPDPLAALQSLTQRLNPGGVIITEDIDFRGHFCHPESAAFNRYIDWYSTAVRQRGCDPDIGPRLPSLLSQAGFTHVDINVVQPAGSDNEAKQITPITLEAIAESVLAANLTTPQLLSETVDELYEFANDPTTVMSIPRIVQAWGTWPS
jgi:ubiquinone/menaquinone biosynthesis C-methylase UbiE